MMVLVLAEDDWGIETGFLEDAGRGIPGAASEYSNEWAMSRKGERGGSVLKAVREKIIRSALPIVYPL